LLLSLALSAAAADPPTGRIVGVVRDPSGAAVQGADIELRGLDLSFDRHSVTNEAGRYSFEGVPSGRYEVKAVASGMEPSTREVVAVTAGLEARLDFALRVASQKSMVEVRAAAGASADTLVRERVRTNDSAELLDGTASVSLNTGGGVSSLPAIHGLADERVDVLVNGMSLQPACANHMNPAASYIDPANVGHVGVVAGITPVSLGGDSIGGTVVLDSPEPEFAKPGQGVQVHGTVSTSHRTNGVVNGEDAQVSLSTESFRIGYTGSYVNANDYKDGAGVMVKSTFYEATNHALELAIKHGNQLFTADVGYQFIPQQGFANARMDMAGNQGKFANLHYQRTFGWGKLDARGYWQNTQHVMNILRDKVPGMDMPMYTNGTNLGYTVGLEIPLSPRDTLRVGQEYLRFTLNDWWPPVEMAGMMGMATAMGPNTLVNISNGRRDRFGTYAEWEGHRGRWTELLGLRSDVVRMNTGNVSGYNDDPMTTGSAAYYADAQGFNSRSHARLDNNFDATALSQYEASPSFSLDFGYARKTRSPSLYERYLWVKRSAMSADMNGWFGDGNGYTGNLDLKPEVANTLSATADWHGTADKRWELKLTPYYTRVQDYIDVNRCPVISDGSNGCSAARFAASTGFVTLQFANHDAELHGVDVSGRLPLGADSSAGSFALTGLFGYVRGKDLSTGGNLYRIMPVNGRLALEHRRGNWSSAFETQAVDAKRDVEKVRIELPTPGYVLLNVRSGYRWHLGEGASLRLDASIENLAGRNYVLPLGGRYWVGDKTGSSSVPGMGRSIISGLTFQF
jgi:iron complex outermembrane receptor protein